MSKLAFTSEHITDQKRLTRGEHLLMARSILRARDGVHHRKWSVLMMSGMSPSGNIKAIRELMPRAHVTAVDLDQGCLSVAIDCGADDIVQCDVSELGVFTKPSSWDSSKVVTRKTPNVSLRDRQFDFVDLDLCGIVNEESQASLRVNRELVSKHGALGFTFSYGRDVTEVFEKFATKKFRSGDREIFINERIRRLESLGVKRGLAIRIAFLCGQSNAMYSDLASIVAYRGAEMPMCSLLFDLAGSDRISYVQLEHGDFELAVTCPDPASMYDCPQDRIDALRRRHAAVKASYTRSVASPKSGSQTSSPQERDEKHLF